MEERRFGARKGWRLHLPIDDLPFLSGRAKRNILAGYAMRVFGPKLPAEKLARSS
jgi:hypothetical protein